MTKQEKVNQAKVNHKGNSLKQELTSILYPSKYVEMYYCQNWSTKANPNSGNSAGYCYVKNGKQVDKPKHGKGIISPLSMPTLREAFKCFNVVV